MHPGPASRHSRFASLCGSLLLLAGLTSIAIAIPGDDPPPPKDGPLPWTIPTFLKEVRYVLPGFTPWDAVKGRNGNYYGCVAETWSPPGGVVYAISPAGAARALYHFPMRWTRYRNGYETGYTTHMGPWHWLTGTEPRGRLAIGQEGAIYGYANGGLFGRGLIYKVDLQGRFQVLHHIEKFDWPYGALVVAENGNVFAAFGGNRFSGTPFLLLRLSKDGQYQYITGVTGQEVVAITETANHEIVVALVNRDGTPTGTLWRLNSSDELELLAEVGSTPRALTPLPNGDVLCRTDARLVRVSPTGEVSEVHAFSISPNFLTIDQDGNFLGSTTAGGLNNDGTWFRVVPGSDTPTVLGDFPNVFGSLYVATWMAKVFPLRVAAEKENLPPCGKDDVVAATTVKPVIGGGLPQTVIRVLNNDTDRDGDPLLIESVGEATHGTVAVNAAKRAITYTALSTTVKSDRFRYTVADGKGGKATAQVIIRSNPAGSYRGDLLAVNGETPGAKVGSVVVNVSAARTISGTLEFEGKSQAFTARFNEFNQAGAALFRQPEWAGVSGLQLSLRSNDGVNTVHAVFQHLQFPQPAVECAAECVLAP